MPTIIFCILLVVFTTQVGNLFGSTASWCALIASIYLFGPILIYFSKKMHSHVETDLEPVDPFGSALPTAQRKLYYEIYQGMSSAEFPEIGCMRGRNIKGNSLVAVFQNAATTDIAQLILINLPENVAVSSGGSLTFTRVRTDNSKLMTTGSTLRPTSFPRPEDSVHRTVGKLDFKPLWELHCKRVAGDPTVVENKPVHDALAFQNDLERKAALQRLESGNWQYCENRKMMRPTLKGAYNMAWRKLPPFSFYFGWRENRAASK